MFLKIVCLKYHTTYFQSYIIAKKNFDIFFML